VNPFTLQFSTYLAGAIMSIRTSHIANTLVLIFMLLGTSTLIHAKSDTFHSTYFDISLAENLKLQSKTEQENDGFYRYVFATSSGENAEMQMRVIVSSKGPENDKGLEAFQTETVGNMAAMFMDSFRLYQYINTPENKKVLGEKPSKLKLGDITFAGITMYFGNIDASFWVANSQGMTYAFTLISRNPNQQTRSNNLKRLTKQLQTIQFNTTVSK
jgi:hypothetical protein